MNFQHPLRTDLQVLDVSKKRSVRDNGSIDATLPRILKHGLAALLGGGAIYLVAATSVTALLVVIGAVIGLVALAAATCIYVQNNTPL